MDDSTRFLILSLQGESYALPITGLVEITEGRNIQKDSELTEVFAGKFEFRGMMIPVLNLKKILKLPGQPGTTLLVIKSGKGMIGILVDAAADIFDTEQRPLPLPKGVVNPGLRFYKGLLRYKENLALLLNEDGLLS